MHPMANGLLDSDGSLGSGVYLPELDNPDHCGAQSSTLWEFTTLMVNCSVDLMERYCDIMAKINEHTPPHFYSIIIILGYLKQLEGF